MPSHPLVAVHQPFQQKVNCRRRDWCRLRVAMSDMNGLRLDWLKGLRDQARESIDRGEQGLHLIGAEGDEHMRNAVESWLEQQRSFTSKVERRIQLEERRLDSG